MIIDVPILDDLRDLVRADPRPDYAIAKAAVIHQTTFSTFMSGKRGLNVASAERLAAALGQPLALSKPARKPAK